MIPALEPIVDCAQLLQYAELVTRTTTLFHIQEQTVVVHVPFVQLGNIVLCKILRIVASIVLLVNMAQRELYRMHVQAIVQQVPFVQSERLLDHKFLVLQEDIPTDQAKLMRRLAAHHALLDSIAIVEQLPKI